MAISLQSYNQILGKLVRKIIADTPVNDINTGSVLLTLLEAIAAQDFENSASILSVLETLNIDALKNQDLDARAADYGISRISAVRATGFIQISDSSITKRATTLYAVKPAPIAGDTKIYVNDASSWNPAGGTLYIGRGTQQFEGPVTYTSIVDNGSFYTINLSSTLMKDHLASDSVVDGQDTVDRLVSAGTVAKIPSNNLTPEVRYVTLRDIIIPAGEDSVNGIAIIAEDTGTQGNGGINSITTFDALPFPTAEVTNTSTASGGRDIESDDDLRERLKNYSATLARGTRAAILSAIIGVSDSTDGKQVASAVIQEPTTYGEPSIVYVDDGSGFQPTTQGQSVDVLLASASGGEQFLQLSNFPVPRPQAVNQNAGPIELVEGMRLVVSVDSVEQEVIFHAFAFNNIAAATLIEIAVAINTQANDNNYDFRCRLADSSTRILLYPTKFDAEFIQVVADLPSSVVNANTTIGFPTNKYSYISLYRNNTLLRAQETAATLLTTVSPWTSLNTSGTLVLAVDGTPAQTAYFDTPDFSGTPISAVSPAQWAAAMNLKFAGVTASATSNGKIQIASNKSGAGSALTVIGGTYVDDWFSGVSTTSTGSASDFSLNRQTGNVKLTSPAAVGDSITAGNADSKGYIVTVATNTGAYDLSEDAVGRPSQMVVVPDGVSVVSRAEVSPPVGSGFKILTSTSAPGLAVGVMRVLCQSASTLQGARVGDFIYLTFKSQEVTPVVTTATWFAQSNTGLFKISAKGSHTTAGTDTYVDVVNVGAVEEPASGYYSLSADGDVQVFGADAYPQIWKASYVSDTIPVTLQQLIASLTKDLLNVKGSLFKTNTIKITSTTENGGAISVPVSVGKLSFVVDTAQDSKLGNQSHIATRVNSSDMMTWFKRGAYTQRTSTNTLLLDRSRYVDVSGSLSSNSIPGSDPQYAENLISTVLSSSTTALDDIVSLNSGSNKSLFRSITDLLPGNEAGTRKTTPYTTFDYLMGDTLEILKPLSFAADDSVVFVLDGDAVSKTINVNFWRTGRVNSQLPATNSQFSADDADNESGVNFSSLTVWPTTAPTNTNFEDYAAWFCSRNWYRTGGSLSSDGTLLVRAKEYGPIGDSHRFSIDYPSSADQTARVEHSNNPEYTTTTYYFGSDSAKATGIIGGTLFSVAKIQTATTTAESLFSSGKYFYLYTGATTATVFWYALNNDGTSQPTVTVAGVTMSYVKINTVNTGDTATAVALKTAEAIDQTDAFSATVSGSTISFFNNFNTTVPVAGQSTGLSFVFDQATNRCRYTFQGSVNLASLVVGDVMSVSSSVGISSGNSGTFYVENISVANQYVDIYNPYATPTTVGRVDRVSVTGVTNTGVKMVQTVTVTAASGADPKVADSRWFSLLDETGSPIVFWYDLSGSAIQPVVAGAVRYVKITTVVSGDASSVVASKTAVAVDADSLFSATYTSGSTFQVTNSFIGPFAAGTAGSNLGFTFAINTAGVADALGGKYFKIYDQNGSVAVWFNVNGESVPPHGCTRAIQVILSPGTAANAVASTIAATVDADPQFVSTASTNTVAISNYFNGTRSTASDGAVPYSSGFTVTVAQTGQNNSYDAPSSSSGLLVYSLTSTDVASIADTVNSSVTATAAVIGLPTATITMATKEELLPVGYGHNTDPTSGANSYVSLYDGASLVRNFSNSNPNFVLKSPLLLQGVEPTIYDMATCPNPNSAVVGEQFKLIPKTIKNVKHHLTHKALSQLPIVADIDIAGNLRKIQIKSKKLGTQGAVEVVGGRANIGELSIISTAGTAVNDTSTASYLTVSTQAYPNTLSKGDVVKIYNSLPAKRRFTPDSSIKVDVVNNTIGNVKYYIGSRDFNYSPYTKWTITDASSTYGAAAGTVWDWTHNQGGAKAVVNGKVQTYGISNITRTSGVAYVSVSSSHTLLAGQIITISGVVDVPAFNGTWTVLSPGSSTFQFTSPGSDTYSSGGTITSVETQSATAQTYIANGTALVTRLRAYDFSAGTTSSPFTVSLAVDSLPVQADYFFLTGPEFNAPGTTPTFAVWFDIDGNGTTPSNTIGTPYNLSTDKIQVSILSTDTPNQVASKLSAALTADTNFQKFMVSTLEAGTDLSSIQPGDTVNVWPKTGDTYLTANWPMGNQSQVAGSLQSSGFPVLSVDAATRSMVVLNPNGRVMSSVFTGATGGMSISPSVVTRLRLKHGALNKSTIVVSGGVATATTETAHGFSIGDSVVVSDTILTALNGTFTVTATDSPTQFKFSTGVAVATYQGNVKLSGVSPTRYRISSLGFKGLFKIEYTQGSQPRLTDCGVSVDDFIEISGSTFKANNRGRFRILAVDNTTMVIQNPNGVEELDTHQLLNYRTQSATWVTGANTVTGTAGTFSNVLVGDWVRSVDDGDGYFVQVVGLNNPDAKLATTITLGQNYRGVSGTSMGVVCNFETDVNQGTELLSADDIKIYDCDSTVVGDSLVIDSITDSNWFNSVNSGNRPTTDWGSSPADRRQYVMVTNTSAVTQYGVSLSVSLGGMYLLESESALYETIRVVESTAISRFNFNQRIVYATPNDRTYKMSSDYGTKVMSMGKMGFPLGSATGIDGYSYYTGLMRTVQRTIDGYEPDAATYPGRRAVGSSIEVLPPLIKDISMILKIATKDGVNLNDITNDIKSTIITYIASLGVGADVVLSEVIRRVKDITGIDAVTFTSPSPSLERIAVNDNEKALTSPDLISLS